MATDTTTETPAEGVKTGEEGGEAEMVNIPKKDYDVLNQTIGSMKREIKDLKKSSETSVKKLDETSQTKPEENVLLQKLERMALRQAGLTHNDDIELAKTTAKKWNMDVEDVLVDEDFKVKLERQQTTRSNAEATSGIRGKAGTTQAKNTPEYWVAKGTPPTAADVPDRKTRAKIARAMVKGATSGGKTFYND